MKFIIMSAGVFATNNITSIIGAKNVKNGGNFSDKGEAETEAARIGKEHGFEVRVVRVA